MILYNKAKLHKKKPYKLEELLEKEQFLIKSGVEINLKYTLDENLIMTPILKSFLKNHDLDFFDIENLDNIQHQIQENFEDVLADCLLNEKSQVDISAKATVKSKKIVFDITHKKSPKSLSAGKPKKRTSSTKSLITTN